MPSCKTYHLTWVSLMLDMRYLFMAVPTKHNCCPLLCMRGITSHCPSWLSTWDGSTILFQTRCCYVGSEDRLDHCTPNTEISESNLFIFSNYFNGKTLNLHIGLVFALHQQEYVTSTHVFLHPEPSSHLTPQTIALCCPRALVLGALHHALNLHQSSVYVW